MVINSVELLNAVAFLTDDQNMRITLRESDMGALVCGTSTFLGGLIAGPIGLAIGGTLGGIGAAVMYRDEFEPVNEIIRNELSPRETQQLTNRILAELRQFELTDLARLIPLLMNNNSIKRAVLDIIKSFITNELRLEIID